jgi:hypothetical protein
MDESGGIDTGTMPSIAWTRGEFFMGGDKAVG